MTAKEYVKSKKPKAMAERQKTNGGEVYWLIRELGEWMYIASGKTQSNAWANAKKSIQKPEPPKGL